MLDKSGIPPLEPIPIFLIISAIPPRPGAGLEAGAKLDSLGDDISSLAILACEFWRPDFRPGFPGSSLRPRSKALADALKSPKEYCACLEKQSKKRNPNF